MALKRFKKLQTKDEQSRKLQNNIEAVVNPIVNSPIIDGVLIKDICLTPLKANYIKHSLGRIPLGYIVIRKREDSRIWDIQDFNPNPSRTFAITCSHDVQIDIWLF